MSDQRTSNEGKIEEPRPGAKYVVIDLSEGDYLLCSTAEEAAHLMRVRGSNTMMFRRVRVEITVKVSDA